jgi:hypothetical protein
MDSKLFNMCGIFDAGTILKLMDENYTVRLLDIPLGKYINQKNPESNEA